MSGLTDYQDALDSLVPQVQVTRPEIKDAAIRNAMRRHSRNFPREIVEDMSGDGGFRYDLSDLESWEEGFSRVSSIEYPVDDTVAEKDVLDQDDWRIYADPTNGDELHFVNDTPETTEAFRVVYTARHSCTSAVCTVPADQEEAVQNLAASFFCRILAATNAPNQDSTIAADSVDHGSQHKSYLAIAQTYEAEYNKQMGLDPNKPKPAGQVADWDVNLAGGADRLTHRRRYR